MSTAIIYMDQHAPDGRTIRYNIDETTQWAASLVASALRDGRMLEIPNEKPGGEPIFLNPERVASITPGKES